MSTRPRGAPPPVTVTARRPVVRSQDVFYTDERETAEHCHDRTVAFLEWLNKRPEKCIAVVTHSSFLRHLFSQFGDYLHQDDKDSLQRSAVYVPSGDVGFSTLKGGGGDRAPQKWGVRERAQLTGPLISRKFFHQIHGT